MEQHPFPRLQGTWVTRGMQASKARMSPCSRSAPGSACDVNRHLDKHKPSAWFFIPATLLPEQPSELPSQASPQKEAFVLSGAGEGGSFIFRHSGGRGICPCPVQQGWALQRSLHFLPSLRPSWEIPRRPFQPAVCPGRVGSGGRRKPSGKGELALGSQTGGICNTIPPTRFPCPPFPLRDALSEDAEAHGPSALSSSEFPTPSRQV